jgi:Ca2+-binding EF-hand superfamily protein
LASEKKTVLNKDNLVKTFKTIDLDGNGYISVEELRRAFEVGGNHKTLEFWNNFVSVLDKDGDHKVTLEEFCSGMEDIIK